MTGIIDTKDPNLSGKDQPTFRVDDPNSAASMIAASNEYLQGRLQVWDMVMDMYDRRPPDDPQELKKHGLGGMVNVDWGYLEGGIQTAVEHKYHLATRPKSYLRLACHGNYERKQDQLEILEEEDKLMMDEQGGFASEIQTALVHQKSTGLGILQFDQPTGWTSRAVHPAHLVYPVNAGINLDRWDWCAMRVEFDIPQLLKVLSHDGAAKAGGYRKEAVRGFIKHAVKDSNSLLSHFDTDPLSIVNNRGVHDLQYTWDDKKTEGAVWVLWVREWDGSISESGLVKTGNTKKSWDWLYRKENKYERLTDNINLFPDNMGHTLMRNIRGYGEKMLPTFDAMNRTLNSMMDYTILTTSLVFSGKPDAIQHFQEMIVGPYTFIPDALNLQQNAFGDPSGRLIKLTSHLSDMAAGKNLTSGGATSGEERPNSATGEVIQFYQGRQHKQFEIDRFYDDLSCFHKARWRRIWKETNHKSDPGYDLAMGMKERVFRRGVIATPKEDNQIINEEGDFKAGNIQEWPIIEGIHPAQVRARRAFGDGDMNHLLLSMQQLKQTSYSQMTEGGRRSLEEDITEALLGDSGHAERYFGPREGLGDRESENLWRAQVEHDQFEGNASVSPRNDDLHLLHLTHPERGHSTYAQGWIQAFQNQQVSAAQALPPLSKVFEHAQAHIQMAAADPALNQVVAELNRFWNESLGNLLKQLQSQVQKEQEAAAQAAAEQAQAPQMTAKEAAEIEIKRAETEAKVENDTRIAEATVRAIKIKAEAEANAKVMKARIDEKIANTKITDAP